MGARVVFALRVVIGLVLAGSVFVQVVMVPLIAIDLGEAGGQPERVRWPLVVLVFLGVVTVQVTAVCLWKLSTLVRQGTAFSAAAFTWVDLIIGAATAAAVIVFSWGVLLAPGEDVAPGAVLLIGGLSVLIGGVALVVLMLRTLLAQATRLQTELAEVI